MSSPFKQLRFGLRLLVAYFRKYYLATSLGVVLGAVVLVLSPRLLPYLPRYRSTQIIAIVGRYTPSEIPYSLQQKISLGLTTISPSGQPVAGLATSWKADATGQSYTFTLAEGLRWQNGSAVKSRDINYRFKDTDFVYPSDTQIVVNLKEPYSPLPVVLSRPAFKTGLLGAGSYKVSRLKKTGQTIDSLTLVPPDSPSRLPRLRYYFYPSEQQARLAFKLGTVNYLEDIQDPADLAEWPSIRISTTVQKDRYVGIFFNTQQFEKSLRQALAYAIDKSRWSNRAYSPLAPTSWAYNPDVKPYDLDLARAKQLLAKVGKKPDKIILTTLSVYLPTAEAVRADWQALGVPTEIQVVPELPSDFTALIIGQKIPTDPDQYSLWHSTQETNISRFNHPRADKLLEDGRKTLDPQARKDIYFEFQKFISEELPVIFLYHPTTYFISRL
ncbi:MAG: Extracellular solute-binding protein family 5 [Candidatus Amesbacteria bacterium GW2011_GWB1_47_26]|uniref:Extracellular solute-binding protein family 5 n=1 Tax=Candidatus Amesbacteria bacterium GW2011_GWC2_45_19 TaxID=1618366 RepID=A0A0G1M189_9BACT|nr:MAG: Extracellular solute-binding protein family 5 [Candidatus Amesbacteria bacterium GW2011_GWC2_45_19]KKU37974.1 MAG: Extracellular solute-binding protein family 5 [Candidatus Amesbacteria bacterium GW2011_GWA1_46_35]KKU68591.1 MAG: ABC-type dipeptide transport system, periplasmic component [Microgenomates group bacterium GW2011_GWC1_47_20]KKU74553.1 MAG: Extracellular solute-binding protein family 5 [Candidatus Amesbacteria bacterium GW2011_GWB1_47_26]